MRVEGNEPSYALHIVIILLEIILIKDIWGGTINV
jgi:hypothetical protein